MRSLPSNLPLIIAVAALGLFNVPAAPYAHAQQRGGDATAASPQTPGRGGGGRGGRGRGNAFSNLTLITTAWPDGGMIPARYTQAGPELSPAMQWSTPPTGTASFVLIFHDADAMAANNSTEDFLQWLVWNIPGTAASLPQGMADGFELPGGTRQISATGSRYRGPGASATGPVHHYVLDLYALDVMLDIKVNPQGPQEPNPNVPAIRASIMQAMTGHIRGRTAYFGLFRRPQ
jgi:Raf kinase inhibitor-like YbhB/YbcL family protein